MILQIVKRTLVAILVTVTLASVSLNAEAPSDVVYSWHCNDKKIALTFDDGPHPYYTAEILEILAEYDVKATFFLIGDNVTRHPEIVKMVYEEGHEIGNHTFSHANLKNADYETVTREIGETEKVVLNTVEYKTKLLRPPEGLWGENVCRAAIENQYTVVCWSIDTRDWAHTPVDRMVNYVLGSAEAGDIVLFHDFVSGKSPTPEALKIIIPALIEDGYELVTVSELMGLK